MSERNSVIELHVSAASRHRAGDAHHLGPILLLEELPDLALIGTRRRRTLRMRCPDPSAQQRGDQDQCDTGAGTASSIQFPVALQSFSNAARSWDNSLRSAGSFIVTSPRAGSTPSTTT